MTLGTFQVAALFMTGAAVLMAAVPAKANITTTTTTIYSYDFPGQGEPATVSVTTGTEGFCGPVYNNGEPGGGHDGDHDMDNDGANASVDSNDHDSSVGSGLW